MNEAVTVILPKIGISLESLGTLQGLEEGIRKLVDTYTSSVDEISNGQKDGNPAEVSVRRKWLADETATATAENFRKNFYDELFTKLHSEDWPAMYQATAQLLSDVKLQRDYEVKEAAKRITPSNIENVGLSIRELKAMKNDVLPALLNVYQMNCTFSSTKPKTLVGTKTSKGKGGSTRTRFDLPNVPSEPKTSTKGDTETKKLYWVVDGEESNSSPTLLARSLSTPESTITVSILLDAFGVTHRSELWDGEIREANLNDHVVQVCSEAITLDVDDDDEDDDEDED